MKNKTNLLFHLLIILSLIILPNSTLANSHKLTNLNQLGTVLQASFNSLEPQIQLTVPTAPLDTYSNIIQNLTGISKYSLTYSQGPSTTQLVITPTYKQAFRISQYLTNPTVQSKLTSNDLILFNKAQSVIVQIIKPTMSDYEKELAIHDYIIQSTSYDYIGLSTNSLPESAYTAAGVLINKSAVCEGYSEATKLLLDLVGIESQIVYGKTSNNVGHAWNLVKIEGQWYMLDTTFDDPILFNNGVRTEILSYDYFNVTSEVISKDHFWDTSMWPTASATKYNYYVYSNKVISSYNQFKTYIINEVKSGSKQIDCYLTNYNSSYDLSFIFKYYNGNLQYTVPSTSTGSLKITLS